MKTLEIEWRHLELDGSTCIRCSGTGQSLQQAIAELEKELQPRGVELSFTETTLPEEKLPQSNLILIDGQPLDDVLAGAESGENYCSSCSCLTGRDAYCRTVSYDGETYEEIPEEIIREAVFTALDMDPAGEETKT
ncbi:MAG: DUF2703 domain-containing protein [Thermoplasmatota archaeon]